MFSVLPKLHASRVYQSPVLMGPGKHYLQMGSKEQQAHTLYISLVHISRLPRQTSLTQHKLKDKIIKNVKITTADHSTKHSTLLGTICASYIPMELAQHVCVETTNTAILHFIFVLQFYPHLTSWEIYKMQCDILRSLTTWQGRREKFKANVSGVTPNQRSI